MSYFKKDDTLKYKRKCISTDVRYSAKMLIGNSVCVNVPDSFLLNNTDTVDDNYTDTISYYRNYLQTERSYSKIYGSSFFSHYTVENRSTNYTYEINDNGIVVSEIQQRSLQDHSTLPVYLCDSIQAKKLSDASRYSNNGDGFIEYKSTKYTYSKDSLLQNKIININTVKKNISTFTKFKVEYSYINYNGIILPDSIVWHNYGQNTDSSLSRIACKYSYVFSNNHILYTAKIFYRQIFYPLYFPYEDLPDSYSAEIFLFPTGFSFKKKKLGLNDTVKNSYSYESKSASVDYISNTIDSSIKINKNDLFVEMTLHYSEKNVFLKDTKFKIILNVAEGIQRIQLVSHNYVINESTHAFNIFDVIRSYIYKNNLIYLSSYYSYY